MTKRIYNVDLFKLDTDIVLHDGVVFHVDKEVAETFCRNFYYMQERGDRIPVLRGHGETPYQYGYVRNLEVRGNYLVAGVEFTDEDTEQAFRKKLMREWSPGFDRAFVHPHSKEELGPTLIEFSFCAKGHQFSPRDPAEPELNKLSRYTLAIPEKSVMTIEELVEEVKALREQLAALAKPVEEAAEVIEEEAPAVIEEAVAEEELEDDVDKDEIIETLSKRVAELEDQNTKQELSSRGISGKVVNDLVALKRVNKNLYNTTVATLSRQNEVGRGATAGVVDDSVQAVATEFKRSGKPNSEMVTFLSGRAPQMLSNMSAFIKAVKEVK